MFKYIKEYAPYGILIISIIAIICKFGITYSQIQDNAIEIKTLRSQIQELEKITYEMRFQEKLDRNNLKKN